MNTNPATAYEEQLAQRAVELLPGVGTDERLELLGVMDPEDMRTSLAWLASHDPRLFDFALVRDAARRSASSKGAERRGCISPAKAPPRARSSCTTPGTSP